MFRNVWGKENEYFKKLILYSLNKRKIVSKTFFPLCLNFLQKSIVNVCVFQFFSKENIVQLQVKYIYVYIFFFFKSFTVLNTLCTYMQKKIKYIILV